ncbi:aspartyl protease-like protein, putative [Medicago truncatula]|uniref:Aspartyl protease-like protein, putative n=1 Tax=Medicago truncatula TaxID=3880 RepID=G7KPD7_MEDTR|nr:aspartyl protease-like protein, putative [Medicago truncatula]
MELPGFGILFSDGTFWDFLLENYLIQIEYGDVVCLSIFVIPSLGLSLCTFNKWKLLTTELLYILYDMKKSRLGYAPMKCVEV